MGKKKSNSKKGPRGKKARAKAKLERQWGEAVDEDAAQNARVRLGKSRIQTTSSSTEASSSVRSDPPIWHHPKAIESDSESEDHEDDEEDIGMEGACSVLLKKIQTKTNKNNIQKNRTSTTDDESDSDSEMKETEQESEEEDDETDIQEQIMVEDLDLFGQRFDAPPLPNNKDAAKPTETCKLVTPLDSSLSIETDVSRHLLEEIAKTEPAIASNTKDDQQSTLKLAWKRLAAQSFQCNRSILQRQWSSHNSSGTRKRFMSSIQSVGYPLLSRYADALMTLGDSRTYQRDIHRILQLHILNHVLTSRGRIQRHNRRLRKQEEEDENEPVLRDQGYTRATVLVLLPTRGTCHKFLKDLMELSGGRVSKDDLDRFETDYGVSKEEEDDDTNPVEQRRKAVLREKAASWQEFFGEDVNDDDDFKMGLALTPKAAGRKEVDGEAAEGNVAVKLYTDFFKSDIIVASPLALRMLLTSEDKQGNADFLSSIEICTIVHADVLYMQNWDHVNEIMQCLNQQPQQNNDTDFSRVRNYFLEGQAAHWRQLIMCSRFLDASILSTFKRNAKSISGSIRTRKRIVDSEASVSNVLLPVRQVFQRVHADSFTQEGNARLGYFTKNILPRIRKDKQKHTMIYVPSYFDFVSLRNVFLQQELDFVSVTEYARGTEVNRGRARFLQGHKPLMLYTGRAHFFRRHFIKGVRHIIFFGLPEHAEFYSELVNRLNEGIRDADEDTRSSTSCLVLFTKYDAHSLERIVGRQRSSRMLRSENDSFMLFLKSHCVAA